ncbi:hypothetical protein [Bosea sp. RAC05]|uniref:hypothetical protein n=1 Tax=Bosea sp. RAC05 TaxID=1842539 RepID=UPI00083D5562|nr:hypothetical protein [Bosea sp. RAC05]AOG03354.1 hypothetical protein BSY19_5224 [Bosea sp. RAC05]
MSLAGIKQASAARGRNSASTGYPNVLVQVKGFKLHDKANPNPDKDVLIGVLVNDADSLKATVDAEGNYATEVEIKVEFTPEELEKLRAKKTVKHGVFEVAKGKNNNEPVAVGQFVAFDRCKIRGNQITAAFVDRPFGKRGIFDPNSMYIFTNVDTSVRSERTIPGRDGNPDRSVQTAVVTFSDQSIPFTGLDGFKAAIAQAVAASEVYMDEVSVYVRGLETEDGVVTPFSEEFIRRWNKDEQRPETAAEFADRILADENKKDFVAEAIAGKNNQMWEVVPQVRIDYGANSTHSGKIAARESNENAPPLTDDQKRKLNDAERFRIDLGEGFEFGHVKCNVPMQRKIDADSTGRWFGTGVRLLAGFPLRMGRHELVTNNTPPEIAAAFVKNAEDRYANRRNTNPAAENDAPENDAPGHTM